MGQTSPQPGDPARSTTPLFRSATRVCSPTPFRPAMFVSVVKMIALVLTVPLFLRLPLHLVGLVALSQAEAAAEVAGEELDLLDVAEQRLVDGLLVRRAGAVNLLLLGLLALLEESLLTSLLLGLLGGKVLWLGDLVDLHGGGDDVAGVNPTQGDAVDLEGTGDEEDTLIERLEEDDTLAAEATSEEDQDSAGLEGLAGGPGTDRLADLLELGIVLGRVPLLSLLPSSGDL